jgi:hypothetical protein
MNKQDINNMLVIKAFRKYGLGHHFKVSVVNEDGITSCCGAMTTYHDTTECCKNCWNEVISYLEI